MTGRMPAAATATVGIAQGFQGEEFQMTSDCAENNSCFLNRIACLQKNCKNMLELFVRLLSYGKHVIELQPSAMRTNLNFTENGIDFCLNFHTDHCDQHNFSSYYQVHAIYNKLSKCSVSLCSFIDHTDPVVLKVPNVSRHGTHSIDSKLFPASSCSRSEVT